MMEVDGYGLLKQISDNVVSAFSELHPTILMNLQQWRDLKEMIEREITGRLNEHPDIGARNLLED
jgi:hypothetical protein